MEYISLLKLSNKENITYQNSDAATVVTRLFSFKIIKLKNKKGWKVITWVLYWRSQKKEINPKKAVGKQ